MTTAAQVKKLVQPLLDRHPDLALVGRWIYVKPVHHFARAVLIDRMSDKESLNPRWAVVHLFEARRSFPLNWGDFLNNVSSSRPGLWRISEPNIGSALIEQIEECALPALRGMKSLDDYFEFVSHHYFRHHLLEWPSAKVIFDVAMGNLDAARSICRKNMKHWSTDRPEYDDEDRASHARLRALCVCLEDNDRAGMIQLLHEWEVHTVKSFKIEHLWQSTPFPLELQSAGG